MAASFEQLLATPDLVWMGQNTTHVEPPAQVIAAMETCIRDREFQLYAPPGGFARLRELVIEDLGVNGATAWFTEGAVAGLNHICTVLGPQVSRLITTDPGWPWPGRFVGRTGVPVFALDIYDNAGCVLTASQVEEVIEPGSIIYLIDPLNPIGSMYARDALEAIVALARETESYIIHDCTYRHFAEGHTLVADLYPERTFTTYSFSKWLGLAGLRLGAVVANPELIGMLTTVPSNPLGASIIAQRAAIAGLEVRDQWLPHIRSVNRTNIELVEKTVAETGWGRVLVTPSQGNFLAVDISESGWTADETCDALLEDKIFIRPGTYQSPHFGEKFVKISTSVPTEWVERWAESWKRLAAIPADAR